jgi:hypothetical protein
MGQRGQPDAPGPAARCRTLLDDAARAALVATIAEVAARFARPALRTAICAQ